MRAGMRRRKDFVHVLGECSHVVSGDKDEFAQTAGFPGDAVSLPLASAGESRLGPGRSRSREDRRLRRSRTRRRANSRHAMIASFPRVCMRRPMAPRHSLTADKLLIDDGLVGAVLSPMRQTRFLNKRMPITLKYPA